MFCGSFHAIATYLSQKLVKSILEKGLSDCNVLRVAASCNQLILRIRELDQGVRERLAELVARHLGADGISDLTTRVEIRDCPRQGISQHRSE